MMLSACYIILFILFFILAPEGVPSGPLPEKEIGILKKLGLTQVVVEAQEDLVTAVTLGVLKYPFHTLGAHLIAIILQSRMVSK